MTDFADMMRNPARAFARPAEVLDHPGLSEQQKADLLRQWRDDATRLQEATGENMPGPGPGPGELLREINRALDRLGA